MTTELYYLNILILIPLILGPLMTRRFFLNGSKKYQVAHVVVLISLLVGFFFEIEELSFLWLAFCIFGFFQYIKNELYNLWNFEKLVGCIPFVFSIIGAVWLFSGTNELFLMGYNKQWSFYAVLHGNNLGWLLIGLFIVMSRIHISTIKNAYLIGTVLCFVFFLLIAFGIDGVPYIKRLGAFGIITIIPLFIGAYLYYLNDYKGISFYLAGLSLIGIAVTMFLAASNELGLLSLSAIFDAPAMVSIHGLVNGFIVVPSLYFAILFDRRVNGQA